MYFGYEQAVLDYLLDALFFAIIFYQTLRICRLLKLIRDRGLEGLKPVAKAVNL